MEDSNTSAPLRISDKKLIFKGIFSLFLVIALGIAAGGAYLLSDRRLETKVLGTQVDATPEPQSFTVFLKIVFDDKNSLSVAQQATEDENAFSLLEKTMKLKQMEFSYKEYPFGKLVESVNLIKNTGDMAWIYFVNEQSPSVGADQYLIKPGDVIEWKYQKLDK